MVVYQPPETVMQAIAALYPQIAHVVIVDNGNNEGLRAQLNAAKIHWIINPENNLGLAQNLGIAKARELGSAFVLLMDDDSLPAPDMVAKLHEAWQPGIAVIGPYLEEPELGRPPLYIQSRGNFWFRRIAFNSIPLLRNLFYLCASGSLIPLEIFNKIGGMEESFGLYFIDTEFCLRARAEGYDIVAVQEAQLTHRIGNRSEHRLLGKRISTTNHSPPAREKMFRNRKILWKRYWKNQPGYVLFDILRAKSEIVRVLLFESQKCEKLTAMLRGLFLKTSSMPIVIGDQQRLGETQ